MGLRVYTIFRHDHESFLKLIPEWKFLLPIHYSNEHYESPCYGFHKGCFDKLPYLRAETSRKQTKKVSSYLNGLRSTSQKKGGLQSRNILATLNRSGSKKQLGQLANISSPQSGFADKVTRCRRLIKPWLSITCS